MVWKTNYRIIPVLAFFLISFSLSFCGQEETYLNLSFNDGEHAEFATNLIINEQIELYGVRNFGSQQNLWRRVVNQQGQEQIENEIIFENFNFIVSQWAESIVNFGIDEYLICGLYFDQNGGAFIGKTTIDFNSCSWLYVIDNAIEDQFKEIEIIKELSDGSIIGLGKNYFNEDEDFSFEYASLLFIKLDSDGNEISQSEILILEDHFLRANQIQELPDGDLIVFGSVFHDWDNVIWRLSPDGELLDMYQWGTEDLNEWLPWAVYQGEESFVVAYQTATEIYVDPVNYSFPSLMFFDTENMEPLLVKDYENHNMLACYMHDLVKTPDNGFALMGYASYTEGPKHNFGWILKTDPLGNEEWFKTYHHEEFETFDLPEF